MWPRQAIQGLLLVLSGECDGAFPALQRFRGDHREDHYMGLKMRSEARG